MCRGECIRLIGSKNQWCSVFCSVFCDAFCGVFCYAFCYAFCCVFCYVFCFAPVLLCVLLRVLLCVLLCVLRCVLLHALLCVLLRALLRVLMSFLLSVLRCVLLSVLRRALPFVLLCALLCHARSVHYWLLSATPSSLQNPARGDMPPSLKYLARSALCCCPLRNHCQLNYCKTCLERGGRRNTTTKSNLIVSMLRTWGACHA